MLIKRNEKLNILFSKEKATKAGEIIQGATSGHQPRENLKRRQNIYPSIFVNDTRGPMNLPDRC